MTNRESLYCPVWYIISDEQDYRVDSGDDPVCPECIQNHVMDQGDQNQLGTWNTKCHIPTMTLNQGSENELRTIGTCFYCFLLQNRTTVLDTEFYFNQAPYSSGSGIFGEEGQET